MYQASTEQHRKIVSADRAQRRSGRPSRMRNLDWPRFLRAYYANVDAEDLAARDPAELAGAALSHLDVREPAAQAARWCGYSIRRLREHGYISPHTVIEMVNDDMPFLVDSINLALDASARSPCIFWRIPSSPCRATAPASACASACEARRARCRRKQPRLESFQHIEVDRIVDPAALAIPRARRSSAACATCGSRAPTGPRCAPPPARRPQDLSSLSARFDPSDLSETLALLAWMEDRHFTFLGYREYRLRGRKGQRRPASRSKPPASGFCAAATSSPQSTNRTLPSDIRRQSRSRDIVLVTKANLAVHGAPLRIPRLRRHQAFRRQGPADRREAFLGLVDLRRPTTATRARSPCCATRWRRWWSTSHWRPTAMTARRCSTSSNPFRATNCSRRASPN